VAHEGHVGDPRDRCRRGSGVAAGHAAKPNVSRAGWLIVNRAVAAAEGVVEPVEIPATPEAPEPVESPRAPLTDEQRLAALAIAIIETFTAGRGYLGNKRLCESETVLRQWLQVDGIEFDESDLPAALTRLETATPGLELTSAAGVRTSPPLSDYGKPLPSRAMLLMTLHPMDSTTYEPADIEPYVV
jgi:hypothetical protein